MKRLIILAAFVAAFALPAQALAWSGSSWSKNTCGADLTTPGPESGPWWVHVEDERGYVILDTTIPGNVKYTALSVGSPEKDAGLHTITFKVANAANHADGLVTLTQPELNCFTPGTPGPKGDKGDNGTNGTNGTNGRDGANGAKGDSGANGNDGANGTNGRNGSDGARGKNGVGKRGPQGPRGAAAKCKCLCVKAKPVPKPKPKKPTGLICRSGKCGFAGNG